MILRQIGSVSGLPHPSYLEVAVSGVGGQLDVHGSRPPAGLVGYKLQALVYDILPSTGRCRKAVLGVWVGYSHFEHRFPAPSSKLCQGHSLSSLSCPPTLTATSRKEGFAADDFEVSPNEKRNRVISEYNGASDKLVEGVHEVEDFHGVYLLLCLNPRFKGRTYIGYTVDPNRRIKQHNTGSHAGGAWRTSGRGPWEMVLIIHGFPNNISALRFEWAWQHPDKCRRLKHVAVSKRSSESAFQHRWRMVCHMLHAPPWNRLALNIRWLKQDFKLDFPANLAPPVHMPVVFGPVRSKKIQGNRQKGSPAKKSSSSISPVKHPQPSTAEMEDVEKVDCLIPVVMKKNPLCAVCLRKIQADSQRLTCFWPGCSMVSHMTCLAQHFLEGDTSHLIPVEGSCPGCQQAVLWGDLIRHFKGCYQNLALSTPEVSDLVGSQEPLEESHWADDLNS